MRPCVYGARTLIRAVTMLLIVSRLLALTVVLLLASCASAPRHRHGAIPSEHHLRQVAQERHRLIRQFVDVDALSRSGRLGVPRVELAAEARGPGISEMQASLVANNAGRAACNRLAKYVELDDASGSDAPAVRLVVTRIVPTGRAAAGASSVIGLFVPYVPFRLPAGLGALAGEAEVRAADGSQIAVMHWARGANSVMNSARVSTIGDAWQLARQFGDQFARAILDAHPRRSGIQHRIVDPDVQTENRALCHRHFGTVNLAGRGASLLLPLSPESIDPGAPVSSEENANQP